VQRDRQLRWGILGAGRIVTKLGEAFRLVQGAKLCAIASRELERAKSRAAEFDIAKAYVDYQALLDDPDVDIIFNTLHNGLHCEWSIRAIEAGKHVLCEKPLACTVAEAQRMFAAARKNGRKLMEAFMYRFHPQIAEVKRRLDAGEIGTMLYIRSSYTFHGRERDNPRYWPNAGGGALMDVGCYCVNLSRCFAGSEPTRVVAQAHFDEATGVDLTLSGALVFDNRLTAHFSCSFEAESTWAAEIVGTKGRLVIPHPWLPPQWPAQFVITRDGQDEVVRVEADSVAQHAFAPFALEIEHFTDCVRNDRLPMFPPGMDAERDSLANMRVIEALLKSAHGGGDDGAPA
jgi:D-xylose 1-dehydrogenase (NADP+, D-xylono-1,5-lactone-forming)